MVRALIKSLDSIPGAKAIELEVVQEAMAWADKEGLNSLRQSLATQLAALYFENEKYQQALDALAVILRGQRHRLPPPLTHHTDIQR